MSSTVFAKSLEIDIYVRVCGLFWAVLVLWSDIEYAFFRITENVVGLRSDKIGYDKTAAHFHPNSGRALRFVWRSFVCFRIGLLDSGRVSTGHGLKIKEILLPSTVISRIKFQASNL